MKLYIREGFWLLL